MASKSLLTRIVLSASLLLAMSGCVAAIGNRPPPASSATLGQQLIDLKKARDEGVINEVEYANQRAKFLAEKNP
ncbi:MAG: hypothetical protein ABIZ49_00715 [Opitutaceae bacterium]